MNKMNPIPEDCLAISPYLTVPDAGALVDFLKRAFDTVEGARSVRPDGRFFTRRCASGIRW